METREKIDHEELERLGQEFLASSLGGPDSELAEQRERNVRAYNAEPVGEFAPPNIEDRSAYVASDVSDVVDGMLPQIMDVFVSDEKAIECEPKKPGPQAEQQAKHATGYLNHLFYGRNDGLSVLHDWLWDAATQRMGFVKVWAENETEDDRTSYTGLTEDQVQVLLADGGEIDGDIEQDENGLLSFTLRNESQRVAFKVACVAPAEMRIDRNSRYGEDPAALGEVRPKRRFELEEMGLDLTDVSGEMTSRAQSEMDELSDIEDVTGDDLHDSHKLYEYAELYLKLDADGDGVAEWLQLKMVNEKLLAVEQVDDHPYAEICLMPRPHAYFGDCPADRAYNLQREQTNVGRAIIDNILLSTNQRTYVNLLADVNLDDVLDSRAGGVVRGHGPVGDALAPIQQPSIPATVMGLQEWLSSKLENRTGFTRYSQGMDADSLNKTATGVSIITQKSEQRIRLMTRFAALGIRKMFQKLLKLATQLQDAEDWYKVNGEFVPVNPLEWRDQFNLRINVGLGHGTREQKMQALMALQPMLALGTQAGVVSPQHIANFIRSAAEVLEFKTPEQFCDEQPSGMPPNPQAFQQMQQQMQQQIQELGQKSQQLEQENQSLKLGAAEKQAQIALRHRELDQRDMELAGKAMEARAGFELKERQQGFNESQADDKSQIAALWEQVQGISAFLQQLTQPSMDGEEAGMDAPAAPYEAME